MHNRLIRITIPRTVDTILTTIWSTSTRILIQTKTSEKEGSLNKHRWVRQMKLILQPKLRLQYFRPREKVRHRYMMLVGQVQLLVVQHTDKKLILTYKVIVNKTIRQLNNMPGSNQTCRDKTKTLIPWWISPIFVVIKFFRMVIKDSMDQIRLKS